MKKFFPKRRLWAIPIIIAALLLVVLIVGQFTPVLTDWLFKPLIDSTTFTAPPNFVTIQKNVVVKKDIRYNDQGALLDIYYPRDVKSPLPLIMWIHGGGFIGGSKENTQVYGMTLANAGYVVANINYDLAPAHKYPTPVFQANQALKYIRENIEPYGGDINHLFLCFFFQAEDGIRDLYVTGVQTCALPIWAPGCSAVGCSRRRRRRW